MKKFAWLMMIGLFTIGLLVGCVSNSDNEAAENAGVQEDSEESTTEITDEELAISDPDTPVSSEDDGNENSAGGGSDAHEGEGVEGQSPGFTGAAVMKEEVLFVGLIDPHTIEVETDEGFMDLQVDPSIAEQLGELSSDTTITIEYDQNEHGQNVLTNFQVN